MASIKNRVTLKPLWVYPSISCATLRLASPIFKTKAFQSIFLKPHTIRHSQTLFASCFAAHPQFIGKLIHASPWPSVDFLFMQRLARFKTKTFEEFIQIYDTQKSPPSYPFAHKTCMKVIRRKLTSSDVRCFFSFFFFCCSAAACCDFAKSPVL